VLSTKAAVLRLIEVMVILPSVVEAVKVEYSFLLAIPTIVAATGYDLIKNIHSFSIDQTSMLIVGFVASFITAIFGIRLLNNVAKRSSMKAFGMYRISLVILVVILVLIC
jgi:undecaprenyl-diphosphatase